MIQSYSYSYSDRWPVLVLATVIRSDQPSDDHTDAPDVTRNAQQSLTSSKITSTA